MSDIETSSDFSSESEGEYEILGYLHRIYDSGIETEYNNVALDDLERAEQDSKRRILMKIKYIEISYSSDSD